MQIISVIYGLVCLEGRGIKIHQGTQCVPRNTGTEQIYHITIRNLGIASGPNFFFLSPRGGRGRRNILMDYHPYSHETYIFPIGAPHAEKNSPRFYHGRASAAFPRYLNYSRFQHCSVQTVLMMTLELPHRAVDIVYFHFLHFFTKNIKIARA